MSCPQAASPPGVSIIETTTPGGGKPPARGKFFQYALKFPALFIVAVIWFLSSQSILPQPKGILGFDKAQHFIAYAVLAYAAGFWFSGETCRRHPRRSFLAVLVFASFYGVVDEIHQYFVPGRDCNIWDWLADTLGAALGAAAALFTARRLGWRGGGRDKGSTGPGFNTP